MRSRREQTTVPEPSNVERRGPSGEDRAYGPPEEHPLRRPLRAPALYVAGHCAPTDVAPAHGCAIASEAISALVTFRLPLPPTWEGPIERVDAAARRARRAYLAVLDAMQRGRGAPGQAAAHMGKLARFVADLRSQTARTPLLHLVEIWRSVERAAGGAPLLGPPPATPLTSAVVCVPAPPLRRSGEPAALDARLEARYAWPLLWLRTRGYLASPGELTLTWRILGLA
jgi:hypothetical protein